MKKKGIILAGMFVVFVVCTGYWMTATGSASRLIIKKGRNPQTFNTVDEIPQVNTVDDADTITTESRLKIQLALILDTSNSMDGLIDQAKNELWKIVNALRTAHKDSTQAQLQIALYEYGNDRLSSEQGFTRKVSAFTTDLDKISEDLFSLTTNGGSEYCGYVIREALKDLNWEDSHEALKMIFIAGNEPFTQGNVSYATQCKEALGKGIFVNTIHCGSYEEGVTSKWQDGAQLAEGKYFNIDHNQQVVYIETPYDDRINALNFQLNRTYVYYGQSGAKLKARQETQDENASKHSKANSVMRVTSKSSAYYSNSHWDLVDAYNNKPDIILEVDMATLPDTLQNITREELKVKVVYYNDERERIKKEISSLSVQRENYIQLERTKTNQTDQNTLGASILKALQAQSSRRGFEGV